ncbi:MAG: DUF2846 domain-containing protein [Gallionella sp.]|nr:DUF2846 domain-containing protein [Gallionella sp.]MDD4947154.1 DUF2846 domain-containing protein [Gallionella sp.]
MNKFAVVLLILAATLTGCAQVPMAPANLDQQAKGFPQPADKGSLYIYRNESMGGAISMPVSINGRVVGKSGPMTYFWFNLKPGKYALESIAENTSTLSLNVEPGKRYFVWQEVKMGVWMARSLLQEMSEEAGKKGVKECKMLAASIADNDITPQGAQVSGDVSEKLRALQKLRDDGVITADEYSLKHKQLLEQY